MTDQQQPTQEDAQKAQQVALAGAEAAAAAATAEQANEEAKRAMRSEAKRVQLDLSDEQISLIADAFVAKTVQQFEARGAFDPPPERVQAPEQPKAPPAPGEQQPPQGEKPPQAPQKRTWAHKFMGVS